MLRRYSVFALVLALAAGLLFVPRALNSIRGFDKPTSQEKPTSAGTHTFTLTKWGPSQETIDASRASLLRNPSVLKRLGGSRFRLISFQFIDGGKVDGNIVPPEGYRAILFDYTHNLSYSATGRFESPIVQVAPNLIQPIPSDEEFDAAVAVVSRNPKYGAGIADGTLSVYNPMPPLVDGSLPVGKVNRTLAVGLQSSDGSQSQILGVDMITDAIITYPANAPEASVATPDSCGVASQSGGSSASGQYNLIISRAGVEIWNLVVVTPSISSGGIHNNGSGLEVLNVNYRGTRILTRGHMPILNVKYDGGCGPYRDWLNSQSNFTANGSDLATGIRLCTSPPQTILESGTDAGNFSGVAIWDDHENVELVAEMSAGWYRYLMEWNFSDDGVIRPRFGFGSTSSSCVCINRIHHAYWRFDFDIAGAAGNSVTERSPVNGPLVLDKEGMRPRLFGQNQTWTITSSLSPLSCTIVPGPHDSNYDKYGTGDVWILANHSNEIDDGVNCTSGCSTSININPFVNGESTSNADIVVWYGAHCNRFDASNPLKLIGDHVLGPDIVLKGY
jgi:hypothetical protein